MATCANCDKEFQKRNDNKGFYRFSIEKTLDAGELARDALSKLTGTAFTPNPSTRKGRFLCPSCWWSLNETVRYRVSLNDFMGKTDDQTYIGAKRKQQSSTTVSAKKPRFTSTPLKVSLLVTTTVGKCEQ